MSWGPPVKVISKWKAPSEMINRIAVCHFAPKIGRRCVSGPLPVIWLVFDWTSFVLLLYMRHVDGKRRPQMFYL